MLNGFGEARLTKRIIVTLAIALSFLGVMNQIGQAAELKKVRLGVATTVLGITYPWLMMPQAIGYWKDEGYDVEVIPIGGSLQVVQQMVGGGIDIGQLNSSAMIQARATNDIPIRAFMANGVIDWSIAVPSTSSIRTVADLKGKKIGVFNLASGGIAFLKSYLRENDVNPETDVQWIAIGLGAQAVQAIKAGQVDAAFFWASANAAFENTGLSLRFLADPQWRKYPDFSMVALQPTIDKNLPMVEAIARGAVKATVFAMANPDCVRKLQWKKWPDTKPTGGADDEERAKKDLNSLQAQLESMTAARTTDPSKLWGSTNAEAYGWMQDFMKQAGLIKTAVPASDLVIQSEGFFERINNFDHDAVVAAAKACNY
jgi:NitT/TauT family transport system substrate-binding protein